MKYRLSGLFAALLGLGLLLPASAQNPVQNPVQNPAQNPAQNQVQALAQGQARVTRVGDLILTISSMTLPGMGTRDTVMGVASFRKSTDGGAGRMQARDACTVAAPDEAGPPGTVPGEAGPEPTPPDASLDAGDPLTLRVGTGVYTTLPRRKQGTAVSYMTAMPVTLKAPDIQTSSNQASGAALTLDIPGAAGGFPAMKDKALPVTAPVALGAPAPDEDVTPQTAFRWTNPTGQASTLVILSGLQEDPELAFHCLAVDDGTFTFPAATVAELNKQGFTAGRLTTVGRLTSRTYQEGDAQLNLRVMTTQVQMDF